MSNEVVLANQSGIWNFPDELELENFMWRNMSKIFNLTPLERQLRIKGQICDILALTNQKQLVIIELKNTEDRYVVNQLTRYYDVLIQEKPFKNKIDYEKGILLYPICPAFHQHNLIDIKYSKLNFEPFQFSILKESSRFYCTLYNLNKNQIHGKYEIRYKEIDWRMEFDGNIPEPEKLLGEWLDLLSEREKFNILKMREYILSFDQRIQEIKKNQSIFYGILYGQAQEKVRSCVEFQFDKRSKKILIFVWLIDKVLKSQPILRMQIDTLDEYQRFCRLIVLQEKSLSYQKLNSFRIGHKFYVYKYNQDGVSISVYTVKSVSSSGYLFSNSDKDQWSRSEFCSIEPIHLIVKEAIETWQQRIPQKSLLGDIPKAPS